MDLGIGILAVGLYLPPIVRRNDWWPSEVVAGWKSSPPVLPPPTGPLSGGASLVAKALLEQTSDPFEGTAERHVMPDGMTVLDLAEQASRTAMAKAGVTAADIDLVLTHTVLPDVLLGNPATQLHHRLGLPPRCFAMETAAASNSFLMQLTLAETMIAAGRARRALLVQACGVTPSIERTDPISPLFGDGATAVVVGPVSRGRGIVAAEHYTDGRYPNTLVASVRGGTWSDPGRAVVHVADLVQTRDLFLATVDLCKDSIDAVLASAGLAATDIAFFAMYQGTPWLRRVLQGYAGLEHARSIDSYARTGYLFAATLPAVLAFAEQDGLLSPGDLVLATCGGTGVTFGSLLLRWGP